MNKTEKIIKEVVEEIREELKKDILSRYNNCEYWDDDVICDTLYDSLVERKITPDDISFSGLREKILKQL